MSLWSAATTSAAAAVIGEGATEDEGDAAIVPMTARSVASRQQVQHVGTG
ncbi:MAG: hypothetical protein HS111_03685 [Kofleriaceae bacterium]|nr:hypothetical protein [Kofleriaceae bacterium]